MAVDNKKAALEAAMKNIKKKFGDGAVMRLGENSSLKVDSISTGSLTLDIATIILNSILLILLRESAVYQEAV